MQGLWQEPDLWAQQEKIRVPHMRSLWAFCWGCTGPCLHCFKKNKQMGSTEYLGCNIDTFKKHIEQQFTLGMSWENYSESHIDHKMPLKYNKPSLEEVE